MKFSDVLRNRRLSLGMTQSDVAKKAGVSTRMVQKYESGKVYPHVKMAHKLSEVLEMEVSDLLEPKKVTNADLRSDIIMKDINAFFKDKKVSKKKKKEFFDNISKAYDASLKK